VHAQFPDAKSVEKIAQAIVRTYDFSEYLDMRPNLPGETEDVLKHMVETLIAHGYEGLLLILDEVSLFMKNRTDDQRVDDEKTLVVLSNRLANGWQIKTSLLTLDLARDSKSLFRGNAPAEQSDFEVEWHGRTIKGRVYMRDLLDIASKGQALPPINSSDTDHDFAVFISNWPCGDKGE
jgi:hypothetical protein